MARSRIVQTPKLLLSRTARPSQPCRIARCASQPQPQRTVTSLSRIQANTRPFSTSAIRPIGITPESDDPQGGRQGKSVETSPTTMTMNPVDLTESKYHELADVWLESALVKFEDLQDEGADVDVEYSSGVMTIRTEAKGTYVLNKQPPNKQIWLSSPHSGPKRYDWCIASDGQGDKEGTGTGHWVYTRDQTTIDQLILEELGVDLETPADP